MFSTPRKARSLVCSALLSSWGCSSASDDHGFDAASGPRDASSAEDAAAPRQDAAPGHADSGSERDAASQDAEAGPSDAGHDDDAPAPKPITATYVYQGGNGGDPYPFKTFSLDRTTGALTQVGGDADLGPSPTFVTPSANGRFLYVANESYTGGVTAASLGADGTPTKLATQRVESGSSEYNAMVFTSLSPNGKFVLAANYYGGRAVSFPVQSDGGLGAPSWYSFRTDAVTDVKTHSVRVDRSGNYAFAPNLELNDIGQLKFDSRTGQLTANTPSSVAAAPASNGKEKAGPRHIALHPSKAYAYAANELNSTLTAYKINTNGTLTEIETESSLTPSSQDHGASDTAAHVLVHPNGKFVYISNRGQDNIGVFSIAEDGSMTLVEHESTRGATPRNFDIDSEGQLMVVANQGSGSLAVFSIASDGKLSPLGALVTGLTEPNAVSIVNVRAN